MRDAHCVMNRFRAATLDCENGDMIWLLDALKLGHLQRGLFRFSCSEDPVRSREYCTVRTSQVSIVLSGIQITGKNLMKVGRRKWLSDKAIKPRLIQPGPGFIANVGSGCDYRTGIALFAQCI